MPHVAGILKRRIFQLGLKSSNIMAYRHFHLIFTWIECFLLKEINANTVKSKSTNSCNKEFFKNEKNVLSES